MFKAEDTMIRFNKSLLQECIELSTSQMIKQKSTITTYSKEMLKELIENITQVSLMQLVKLHLSQS